MVPAVPAFVLKFSSPFEVSRFVKETEPARSCFVPTQATPDIGEAVEVEIVLGLRRQLVSAEVESVESDPAGVPGIRVGFSEPQMNELRAFEQSVAPAIDLLGDEPTTNPNAEPAPDPSLLKTIPAHKVDLDKLRRAVAPLDTSSPAQPRLDIQAMQPAGSASEVTAPGAPARVEAQRPTPSTPGQPSAVTPRGSPVRIDAQPPKPSTPGQPSAVTPGGSPVRIDAQRPKPSTPGQPSAVTPGGSPVRIDAQRPRPSTPGQPSAVTPGGSPVRIDAQPPRPSTPGQPSAVTPGGSPLRIDAQPPRPMAPGQPSMVTPGGSPVRIDAQPLGSVTAPLPPARSGATPSSLPPLGATGPVPALSASTRISPSGIRSLVGPVVPAPPAPPAASAPPPPAPAVMPPMSAPRPVGTTRLTPALAPPTPEGRVGRLGEQVAKLGFPLTPAKVARLDADRAALPATLPIAWLLGVTWVRAGTPAALASLINLAHDVVRELGGVFDELSETGATFVFFGLGSQGACVLAAQELRERVEAYGDGRAEAPSLACAMTGGRLQADQEHPVTGDAVGALASLLGRAQPGQVLLARNLANGVTDLVATAPTADDVQLAARRPPLLRPLPTVGLEPLLKLFALRVQALGQAAVAPLVVAGPRRSGRTHLAQELARRAHGLDAVVALTSSNERTALPFGAIAELVCQLTSVSFEERHAQLGPTLERLGVAPVRRAALLGSLGLLPSPVPFTPRQVVDALRLVTGELAKEWRRVLVFDGLDHADAGSLEVVRELLRTPTAGELLVLLTTPEQAATLVAEGVQSMPRLGTSDVETLLQGALGVAPTELRDALLARTGGLPGQLVDLLLVTVARGAVRPKGETLVLEGSVPQLELEALLEARLVSEGARCRRLLEAASALGDKAEGELLSELLPGVTQEAWPRATTARLLMGTPQGGVVVPTPFSRMVLERRLSGPGLFARAAAALAPVRGSSIALGARTAELLELAEEWQRAGTQWREVAEAAVGARDLERAAQAQEGMGRVLRRHPRRDSGEVLATRLELWARAACMRLAIRDVAQARADLDAGLDAQPQGMTHVELLYAQARVLEAEGRRAEADEGLAEAVAAAGTRHALQAPLLALRAEWEEPGNAAKAQETWHQALSLADAFLPLAPWFGEVDFRGRVEARIGALFIGLTQPSRAHAWLVSASERFKAARAPLFAARVMANVGTVSTQLGAFPEAGQWFGAAASFAESGGDFLFQAKQLLALARVLKRQGDSRVAGIVDATLGLAEALGWDEGIAALLSLR